MPQKAELTKKRQTGKNAKSYKSAKIAKIVKNGEIVDIAEIADFLEMAETETVRFLEKFKKWVFLGKKTGFSEKSLNFIRTCKMWQICCRIRIQWFFFLHMSSALLMCFFGKKMGKLECWTNSKR